MTAASTAAPAPRKQQQRATRSPSSHPRSPSQPRARAATKAGARRAAVAAPSTPADAHAALLASITEKQFQDNVLRLAALCGWEQRYHTHDSRRSDKGFPDLVLCRWGHLIFAELKSQKGRVRPEQHEWLDALKVVAASAPTVVSVYLWRPGDWPEIEKVLW